MKIKLLLISAGLVVASSAATIQFSNVDSGPGDTLYAAVDGNLISGTPVFSGYFNADSVTFNFAMSVTNFDIAALRDNFNILTSATIGSNSATLGGSFPGYIESSSVSIGVIGSGNPLIGQRLYQFFGDAADLATSTAFALFDTGIDIVEDSVEVPYTLNLAVGSIVIGNTGSFVGNASGVGVGGSPTDVHPTVQLAVPEPSALLLSAFGTLLMLRRKR